MMVFKTQTSEIINCQLAKHDLVRPAGRICKNLLGKTIDPEREDECKGSPWLKLFALLAGVLALGGGCLGVGLEQFLGLVRLLALTPLAAVPCRGASGQKTPLGGGA